MAKPRGKAIDLSWRCFHALSKKLAAKVRTSGFKPDHLIGITCGGLVPLAIVAEELGTKNVATVSARSYKGRSRGAIAITSMPSVPLRGKKVLLVDEIADSGETLKHVRALLLRRGAKEVRTAAVVLKPGVCVFPPEYDVLRTSEWVLFPWYK